MKKKPLTEPQKSRQSAAGKARWSGVGKKQRAEIMAELARKRWHKPTQHPTD